MSEGLNPPNILNDKHILLKRTFISLAFTVYGITMASHFYMHNVLLLVSETFVLGFLVVYRAKPLTYWMIPIAMVLSVIGDILAHRLGTWVYTNPTFSFGTPLWLPMGWAIMLILFEDLAEIIFEAVKANFKPLAFAIFINVLRAVIFFYTLFVLTTINKLFALIFSVLVVPIFIFANKPFNVVLFIVAAVHGTAFEFFCMQNGAWEYSTPYFPQWGLPISLPMGWGLAANFIWACARGLEKITQKNR